MLKYPLRTTLVCALCLASACRPAAAQSPTEAPAATAVAEATVTAAVPEGYYATLQAETQSAIEARATASPFPTALPAKVTQGWPAVATGERDGLTLTVRLPKDSYWAGEGGLAEVEIRNDGPETVFILGNGRDLASLALLDQLGQQPDPWPFSFASRLMGGPRYLQKLVPGGVLTKTIQFQIPPSAHDSPSRNLYVWGETRFSRPANSEGPDNLWMRLEAGPVKLGVYLPDRAHHLSVDWQVDRNQWRLIVKDGNGQVPSGKIWGEIGIASSNTLGAGPLPNHHPAPGIWTSSWSEFGQPAIPPNAEEITGGWIAAEGYVTATFIRTLPGEADAGQVLGWSYPGPQRENYATLKAAQAAVNFRLLALSPLLIGSMLRNVRIERCCGKEPTQITAEQQVRMPDGGWIALLQMAPSGDYASAGWGIARYDWEAHHLDVHGETAYALERFGWWYLDWKLWHMGLELRAPASTSLTTVLNIARSLSSQ
jgi:hypothetical protein